MVREIALRECVTIKELVNAMFQQAIDKYEAKNTLRLLDHKDSFRQE